MKKPIAVESVAWEEWSEGTRFGSRCRHLTKAAVGEDPSRAPGDRGYRVGVQIEELPPGKQSVPAHYHLLEEEHILMLEGSATLRLGAARQALKAGDYVVFPAGQREGHCLINESDAVCRFLVIGEHNPNDVCVYTDSNKIMVRALRERFDASATRGYWDGEATNE